MCPNRRFLPVTDQVVRWHIAALAETVRNVGSITVGFILVATVARRWFPTLRNAAEIKPGSWDGSCVRQSQIRRGGNVGSRKPPHSGECSYEKNAVLSSAAIRRIRLETTSAFALCATKTLEQEETEPTEWSHLC